MIASARKHLIELVRRPSVNPMGRRWPDASLLYESRVTAYLAEQFRNLPVSVRRQTIAPERENIIAVYDAPNPWGTLIFEVHQDTVPVEAMTIDPFGAEVRDGKLYGRGACDVKGSMAVMLAVFERLVRERPAQSANVILACTVDEEHTFLGVQALVAEGLKADGAIVAEPTMLSIVDAHKGVVRWQLRVGGRACHSSRPENGVNAIYRMGRLLGAIEDYSETLAARPADARLGKPTISVGRIDGGASVNTVPDDCMIQVDRRVLPGESPSDAPEEFAAFLRGHPKIDFAFTVEPNFLACPALSNTNAGPIRTRLGSAIDSVLGSHTVTAVPFGTDASTLAEVGIPSVVFGPGDIAQAHTCDEWIALETLEPSGEILYRLACGK